MNTQAHSNSPEETLALGGKIGGALRGQEIILLCGELGAGKTLLAKGIAAALGIDPNEVVSPSFTLMNRYQGNFLLFHIDLYRLGEKIDNGLPEIDDHIDEGIIVVEWAQYLNPSYFALKNALDVELKILADTVRMIKIETKLDYIK